MIRRTTSAFVATMALGVVGLPGIATCAEPQAKLSKAEKRALNATPDDVAATVTIVNDYLDTDLRLSTQPFFASEQGLFKVTTSDKFLRAYINKKTGRTRIQLYAWLTYGTNWQMFDAATYDTPDGPVSAKLDRMGTDVQSCSTYGCTKREDVGFEVPEGTLRQVAQGARAGSGDLWMFKLNGRYEGGLTGSLLKTEIAGMLLAIERARVNYKLPAPPVETIQ